jgi:hypothetical protein
MAMIAFICGNRHWKLANPYPSVHIKILVVVYLSPKTLEMGSMDEE